jgi:hypothetical protein
MAQFRALSEGVLVNGQTVLSVVKGMGAFAQTGSNILERHGIKAPSPMGWYPQQAWLDAFQEIATHTGRATLRAIGRRIPETAVWPFEQGDLPEALASIDVAYHANHRGGEIGHYKFTQTADRSGEVACNNPFPCDFDLGIVERVAAKFAPTGVTPVIRHADPQHCRFLGGRTCTYLVDW